MRPYKLVSRLINRADPSFTREFLMPTTLVNRKFPPSLIAGFILVLLVAPVVFFASADSANSQAGDDHGDSPVNATFITLGGSVAGRIDSETDVDFFAIAIGSATGSTDLWLYTESEIDTMGVLIDGTGNQVAWDDDGNVGLRAERRNFHLRWTVPDGVYFIAVLGYDDTVGEYVLNARAATDPGGLARSSAPELSSGALIAGTIESANRPEYFQFTVNETENLALDVLGVLMLERFPVRRPLPFLPVDIKVYDSGRNKLKVSEFGIGIGVRIRDDFPPGTYFIRVEVPEEGPDFPLVNGDYPVPYILQFYEDEIFTEWSEGCVDATASLVTAPVEDPLYGCQWHLKNYEPGGHDINIEDVWAQGYKGEGINVVVVDTSIDYAHED